MNSAIYLHPNYKLENKRKSPNQDMLLPPAIDL